MKGTLMKPVVWIGLIEVRPQPGNDSFGSAKGGYVNVLALARSRQEYEKAVQLELHSLRFDVGEIEDPEPLQDRLSRVHVDPALQELGKEVEASGAARCGTFHTFAEEGD